MVKLNGKQIRANEISGYKVKIQHDSVGISAYIHKNNTWITGLEGDTNKAHQFFNCYYGSETPFISLAQTSDEIAIIYPSHIIGYEFLANNESVSIITAFKNFVINNSNDDIGHSRTIANFGALAPTEFEVLKEILRLNVK